MDKQYSEEERPLVSGRTETDQDPTDGYRNLFYSLLPKINVFFNMFLPRVKYQFQFRPVVSELDHSIFLILISNNFKSTRL